VARSDKTTSQRTPPSSHSAHAALIHTHPLPPLSGNHRAWPPQSLLRSLRPRLLAWSARLGRRRRAPLPSLTPQSQRREYEAKVRAFATAAEEECKKAAATARAEATAAVQVCACVLVCGLRWWGCMQACSCGESVCGKGVGMGGGACSLVHAARDGWNRATLCPHMRNAIPTPPHNPFQCLPPPRSCMGG
jgi:hypothetical protein